MGGICYEYCWTNNKHQNRNEENITIVQNKIIQSNYSKKGSKKENNNLKH